MTEITKQLDDAMQVGWVQSDGSVDFLQFKQGFMAGYNYCKSELFNQQKAERERENASRRRMRKLKQESERVR